MTARRSWSKRKSRWWGFRSIAIAIGLSGFGGDDPFAGSTKNSERATERVLASRSRTSTVGFSSRRLSPTAPPSSGPERMTAGKNARSRSGTLRLEQSARCYDPAFSLPQRSVYRRLGDFSTGDSGNIECLTPSSASLGARPRHVGSGEEARDQAPRPRRPDRRATA
jgi:hypothetical protein